MNRLRRIGFLLIVPLFVAGLTLATAPAAHAAGNHRLLWQYNGGFFKDTGAGHWAESNFTGSYEFDEVGRNSEYIELYDAGRDYTVRLYDDAMYLRGGNDTVATRFPNFTKFYDGHWDQ